MGLKKSNACVFFVYFGSQVQEDDPRGKALASQYQALIGSKSNPGQPIPSSDWLLIKLESETLNQLKNHLIITNCERNKQCHREGPWLGAFQRNCAILYWKWSLRARSAIMWKPCDITSFNFPTKGEIKDHDKISNVQYEDLSVVKKILLSIFVQSDLFNKLWSFFYSYTVFI